jgi:pimeloyl-ACP methyl ester carboxylesterase
MTTHQEWTDQQDSTTVGLDDHEVEIAYYEGGDPADHTVVFLHGIPTWSFLWRDVVGVLEDDYHVLAPDMAGYGNSAMWDGFDRSVRAQEDMLGNLLDDLGADRPISLVAHDIGGGAAVRMAVHQPDAVERLVVSNAVCYDSWPVEFVSNLGLPDTTEMDFEELEGQLDFAFGDGLFGDAEDHQDFVEGMKEPWLTDEGRRSLSRDAVATNTNHTTELDYGRITADVTCLWGVDDVMQPLGYGERLAEDVAGDSEVVRLEDAFHWVVEDRTEGYREGLADAFGV